MTEKAKPETRTDPAQPRSQRCRHCGAPMQNGDKCLVRNAPCEPLEVREG